MHEDDYLYGDYSRHYSTLPHHSGPSRDYEPYSSGRSMASGYDDPHYGHDPNPFGLGPEPLYSSRQPRNRGSMPPRAQSGHELMTLGHYNPYHMPSGYPPYAMPGYGYPQYAPQHSHRDDDERERKRAAEHAEKLAKLQADEKSLSQMQKFIEKQHEDQMKREKRAEDARQAEAAAKTAAEIKQMEDKLRADERKEAIKVASDKAKADAEKAAAKKAEEEKAKFDKEMGEIKKKAEELEAAKKKLEEEAKKLRPDDDKLKPPIKFKDAVGRKFSFPWHVCKTWKGMESLILQAFSHVDNLGQMVVNGHYDLIGPDNDIILPQIWETVVKPDMSILMQMWPVPERKRISMHPPHPAIFGAEFAALVNGPQGKSKKSSKSKDKKPPKVPMAPGTHMQMPPGLMIPPPPPLGGDVRMVNGMMPPPPVPGFPPGIMPMPEPKKSKSKDGSKKKSSSSKGILGWALGAPAKSSKKKK